MGDKSKIEWLDGGASWNPITGCDPISEGCENCYAARMSKRLAGRFGYPAEEPFRVTFHKDKLFQPLEWKNPRMIFVCSMGDLFHEEVSVEWIDRVFSVPPVAPHHTYIILTKRPHLMQIYFQRLSSFYSLKNIWLGVTVENQECAEARIPVLLQMSAAKRFVSVEPMLSDIHLSHDWLRKLDWVICGAETGPRKRPMEDAWAESLREQCAAAGVPFFFKKDSHGAGSLNGEIYHNYPVE